MHSVTYEPVDDAFIVEADGSVSRDVLEEAVEETVIAKGVREWLALRGNRWAPVPPGEEKQRGRDGEGP